MSEKKHGAWWVVNRMKRRGEGVDRSYGTPEPQGDNVIPLFTTEASEPFAETDERIASVRYFARMPKSK